MVYNRARSRSLESEDDEVKRLRAKIQKIQHADLTFEDRGRELHRIITDSHRNPTKATGEASSSIINRKGLPQGESFQPRLTGLPVELVENIAIRLGLESLRQLRLSNKTLKVKTGYHFLKSFFTSRVVKPEWESIRRLIMIMNHPDLGSAIRDITVDVSLRHFAPAPASQHRNYGAPVSSRRMRQIGPSVGSLNSQNLSSLLFRLFDKIPMLRSLNFRFSRGRECSAHVLESALDALASSGRLISSLSLGDYDSKCFFRLPELNHNNFTASTTLARIFKHITSLQLSFSTGTELHMDVFASNKISKFPSQLLNMTSNVQNLTVSFPSRSSYQADNRLLAGCYHTFQDFATSTDLTKLVNVEFNGFLMPKTHDLRAFLSRSKTTLKKVRIMNVALGEHPDKKLKSFLQEELTLTEARVTGSTGMGRRCWTGDLKLERDVWIELEVANAEETEMEVESDWDL